MRVNRRFLGWGVFLVAIGGVLVVADLQAVDTTTIADALRLWPLAFVALGLGLVLRRTRLSLPAGMLAAAVPGLVLGGVFAVAPHVAVACGAGSTTPILTTRQGTFDGPARISVVTGCGELVVDTSPGSSWSLDTGDGSGDTPNVEASSQSLSVDSGSRQGWHVFDVGRATTQLTLPTSAIDDLSMVVNAGQGRIGLPGARVGSLEITANAAQATVDLSQASVSDISGTVNAGQLSFHLGADADIAGSLRVNAGDLQVCAPSGLGLRVHHTGVLSGISVNGLQQIGTDWQSPDYASAAHHADLDINVDLGSVEIDPIGGCK